MSTTIPIEGKLLGVALTEALIESRTGHAVWLVEDAQGPELESACVALAGIVAALLRQHNPNPASFLEGLRMTYLRERQP